MKLLNNVLKYYDDLERYLDVEFIDWDKFKNKSILITVATGLVGRYLIDLLMLANERKELNLKVVGLSRTIDTANAVFSKYFGKDNFMFLSQNVTDPIKYEGMIDYIVHCASNTSPIQYVNDSIGTIETNILGTNNLLNYYVKNNSTKFIYISSFEVYGLVSDCSKIREDDYGIINCSKIRSCYSESKRLSELLCMAYSKERNVDVSILRLSRVFGPTVNLSSSLSINQFIKNGLNKEPIVLKSDGQQLYSFNYVGDVASSILSSICYGETSSAYNVSDDNFDAKLLDFANIVSKYTDVPLKFETDLEINQNPYSNTTYTILDSKKLKNKCNWYALSDLDTRIHDTIDILKNGK